MSHKSRTLRLLCLHGMYQDASTFAGKIMPLRCDNMNVEFVCIDGPFTVVPPIVKRTKGERTRVVSSKTGIKNEFRAWWRQQGPHQNDRCGSMYERNVLISFLREKLAEAGNLDGVLGFSQGASLAAWMCSEQARAELNWSPKLAVLIGSYLSSPLYSLDTGILPNMVSLHLFGANDYVIAASKSQQVMNIFKDQEVGTALKC
ncbi:uncharacterized protein CCR75_008578 [Bremia lactucae]|uniref:Serine hydrolase domain-containing protein n=1 Tax=Bremia lactucae TaxID=4779 RepID=A0A976ILK3_BRELC|nr:hypothetical protein CCR75_008578 [Bremia lactucae]